jgi:hypothetical protein
VPFVRWMQNERTARSRRGCARSISAIFRMASQTCRSRSFRPSPFVRREPGGRSPTYPQPAGSCLGRERPGARPQASSGADRVALGARTVREALVRVAAALPHHVTHDVITVRQVAGGTRARVDGRCGSTTKQGMSCSNTWRRCCRRSACIRARPCRCSSASRLCRTRSTALRTCGPGSAARSSRRATAGSRSSGSRAGGGPAAARGRAGGIAEEGATTPSPLRGDGSLAASARVIVGAMLSDGQPTVERLAAAAGVSVRTLQRRLGEEGHELLAPARSRAARSRARRARRGWPDRLARVATPSATPSNRR